MKRAYYISLFSLLGMMITVSLYYCIVFGIIANRLIHWLYVECFLEMTLSPLTLTAIALIGVLIGYRAGKKWWQIIYVDRVYYFDTSLAPQATQVVKPRAPRKTTKKTQE